MPWSDSSPSDSISKLTTLKYTTIIHICVDTDMVYLTPMSLPSTSARASTITDFTFTPTPSRSESVRPSFGLQDHCTQSPFGLPFDYGCNFSSSRGGTPLDTLSDGSRSMGNGPGVPMGGSTTQWPLHMAMVSDRTTFELHSRCMTMPWHCFYRVHMSSQDQAGQVESFGTDRTPPHLDMNRAPATSRTQTPKDTPS